jgi:predicted membrane channel-forming protein YqfA (hemolysin III family)
MTNTRDTTARTAQLDDPRTREAFDTVKKYVKLYGAICAITLGTVAVVAISGPTVTTFMWVRSVILLAIAPVLYRMTVHASQGARRRFERVRTLTVIVPIAIIAVDLIPGVCPAWYAVMQAISALALIGAAFVARGATLRTVYPTNS